ncbi:hypothetical protein CHU92_00035 [Flavobacterium cyanobacteriorum]|uniref:DUF4347 domain-containing protein n=1 Tax=Flavobacterium cyanobacteriorum TaxID=2022802 RepID=A0A256AAC7_9FLAO|nr:hypothetical protein CHU92_00035 [Flavobacterium cyanobacteriorum]
MDNGGSGGSDDWVDKDGKNIEDDDLKSIQVYIFYDSEFYEQAMIQYDDAVKKYGQGAVALSNTGTTQGFAEDWAKMNGAPKEVIIMTHGKNQSINVNSETNAQFTSTGDGKTNISGSDAMNVQDLAQPKADLSGTRLNMYTCHSADRVKEAHGDQGPLRGTMQPIADAFKTNFGFKQVKGTNGSVNYHSLMTDGTRPSSPQYMRPYTANRQPWIILDDNGF